MKLIYYIIHNTHTLDHVTSSIHSLAHQNTKLIWDKMVIKNSIEDQIPNEAVKNIINENKLQNFISEIEFVPAGEVNTTYNDLKTAISYAKQSRVDYLLFSKAEYCYSVNCFTVFSNLIAKNKANWVFTPPIINATEIAKNENIDRYLNKIHFEKNDDLTGYDGDDLHRLEPAILIYLKKILYKLKLIRENPWRDIGNKSVTDMKRYEFIAHNVILDINIHLFEKEAITRMDFSNDELNLAWGRIRSLDRLLKSGTTFVINHNCFAIHLFHEIPGARMGRNINSIKY